MGALHSIAPEVSFNPTMLHDLRTQGGDFGAPLRRFFGFLAAAALAVVGGGAAAQPSNTFQFSASGYTVAENTPGFATVTVLFGGGNTSNVTVDYFTSDGSAFAGVDYTASGGTLVFTPGQGTNSFSVPVGDDFIGNGNRQFFANLGASTSGTTVGAPAIASVTILDNEIPQPPVNDPFTNATAIFGLSGTTVPLTNNAATKEASEPNHVGNPGGRSVWFRWTAPANGIVTFATVSNSFDTLLSVYTGNSVNALTPVAEDDGAGLNSTVTFTAVAGTVYRVAVDGAGGAEGTYQLRWSVAGSAGTVRFTANTYEANENESGGLLSTTVAKSLPGARITVTRGGGAAGRIYVKYQVSDGVGTNGAINNINYFLTDSATQTNVAGGFIGQLVLDHLQNSASFLIGIIDNGDIAVPLRSLNLAITEVGLFPGESTDIIPPAFGGGGSTSQLVIYDEDVGTNFEVVRYRTDEGVGQAVVFVIPGVGVGAGQGTGFQINRAPQPNNNTFALDAGSDYATPGPGNDFTNVNITLTWANPPVPIAVPIPIIDDNLAEFNEDLMINLHIQGVPNPAPLGASIRSYLTILHEDRINAEHAAGSVDPSYNRDYSLGTTPPNNATPGANNTVNRLAVQNDGRTVIVGEFTSVNTVGRNRIARMNTDGSLDTAFNPGSGANSSVNTLALQPDQKIIIAGNFSSYNGTLRGRIARVNTNGTLDVSFNPGAGANAVIRAVALHSDTENAGKIVAVGDFTSVSGTPANRIVRLNPDGTLDPTFNVGTGPNGSVQAVKVQANGIITVAGSFTSFNGVPTSRIARLSPDGTVDPFFQLGAGVDGTVFDMELEPAGATIPINDALTASGGFAEDIRDVNYGAGTPFGAVFSGLLTIDYTFQSAPGSIHVYAGANLDPTNLIFTAIGDTNGAATVNVPFGPTSEQIIRIVINQGNNTNASTLWTYTASLTANAVLDPDKAPKTIIVGEFTSVDLRPRNRIARLNPNGTLDESFDPGFGADDTIFAVSRLTNNNSYLIGGLFHSYNSTRRLGLARVLNNGWIDTTFMDAAYNQFAGLPNRFSPLVEPKNFIRAIALETNGNVMIGGSFRRVGGGGRNTAAFGLSSPWGTNVTTPLWIARDDIRNRFNFARVLGGTTAGAGNITLTQQEYAIDETAGFVFVQLTRVNGQLAAAGAQFRTGDRPPGLGAAAAPDDYTALAAVPTWTSTYGGNSNTRMRSDSRQGLNNTTAPAADDIYITINDDSLVEGNETLDLTLDLPQTFLTLGGETIPVGVGLGQTHARLTIVDDDQPPAIFSYALDNFTVNEGGGSGIVTVLRSGNVNTTVSVDFFTGDGGAVDTQDYLAQFGQLIFNPGETEKTFEVPIIDDVTAELDETINLTLTNLTVGSVFAPTGRLATLTIFDNDFATGQIRFSSAVYSTSESDSVVSVVVQRTGGNGSAIQVDLATSPVSAVPGADYTSFATTLTWADGDTSSRTVNIPLLTDGVVDGLKSFLVTLTNAVITSSTNPVPIAGANPATVAIADVDAFGSLQFASGNFSVNENGGQAIITITRTGGNSGTVQVDYQATAGTAVAGVDFTPASGTLVLGPGVNSANFTVPILDNAVQNTNLAGSFNRSVTLDLTTFINGTAGSPNFATLTIVDDERFNEPAGSVDTTYNAAAGANEIVYSLALQPDGRLLIGGEFTGFSGLPRTRLARLEKSGALDPTFLPGLGANATVRVLALQDDGRVLVGGLFTNLGGVVRNRIGRLNPDGSLDGAYDPGAGADNPVYAIALHRDSAHLGKAVIGGAFSLVDGVNRAFVARLNLNGTVDTGFDPGTGANGTIYAVAIQNDGKVLIGGDFTTFDGVSSPGLARLNADGSLDAAFTTALGTGANASVRSIVVQSDGRILLGGLFTDVNGTALNNLARLLATGAVDPSFVPGAGGDRPVFTIALQPDGKILVGGDFENFSGVTRRRITRLLPDGTVDPTINFGVGANAFISAIVVQVDDGKIIAAGGFTEFNDQPRNRLVRLHGGVLAGPGRVEFRRPAFTANEGGTNVMLSVRRIGGTTGAVSVNLATADATATAGLDYTNVNLTLNFPNGEVLRDVLVPVVQDTLPEGNETFTAALSGVTGGATLGPQPTTTATIVDDDGEFTFSSAAFSANENTPTGTVLVGIRRLKGTNAIASVSLSSTGITALDGVDFVGVTNVVVTFQPGQTLRSIAVTILDDNQGEGNETVAFALTDPVGGSLGSPVNATLTIVDNEFAPGVLQFPQTAYQVDETAGGITVTVERINGTSGFVSGLFQTFDITATPGQDYTSVSQTVSFSDGETAKAVFVPILDDTLPESNETLRFVLTNLTGGASLGTNGTAVLTIVDNEVLIRFSSTNYAVSESNQLATITIERFGSTNSLVGADFAIAPGGTATADVDFTGSGGTFTFLPGETVKTADIVINDDPFVEGDETVNLALSNPTGGAQLQPATSSSVLTILDNDSLVNFTTNAFSVNEADGTATITLTRTGNLSFDAILSYAVSAGTATPGADFTAETNVVTFLAGETNQSFTVAIVNDGVVESAETVNLQLLGGVGATLGATNTAVLTIVDDDTSGTFSFASSSFAILENGVFATITVVREGGSAGAVSVNFATADGSALAGVDYTATSGVLAFATGETNKTFLVPVLDDAIVEGDETVLLTLSNPAGGASLGAVPAAVLTITDDDFFGTLQFSATNFTASEGAGLAVISVSRVGGSAGAVSVNFGVAAGTAQVPGDFALTNGTLSWAAGDGTDKTFTVRLSDDAIGEFDETVLLSLSGVTGGASLGTPDVSVLTITDNDLSVGFSSATYNVSETGLVAVITVNRLGLTNGTVSVDYTTTNALGTATAGADFTNRTGSLFWADGDGSPKTFVVPVVDDTIIEGDETVMLDLLNPVGATLAPPSQAILNIVDNDVSPFFTSAGARLVVDPNGNGVIDPGETVTVSLALRNVGTTNSTSLLGSLLATNGVTSPGGSQNYGVVVAGGPAASRDYSFTAGASNGAVMTAILQLQDGAQNLGAVPFVFNIGTRTNKFLNTASIAINDDGPAQPYPSVINVSGVPGTVSKVSVVISNLSHGFPLDIDMLLVSPTGQRVILMSDAGGSAASPNAINNVTLKFDDAAASGLGQTNQIVPGTYKPSNFSPAEFFVPPAPTNGYASTLAAFNGINPNGQWLLYILDDDFIASGSIASGWCLEFTAAGLVNPPGDLKLSGSFAPSPAIAGAPVTYTLTVTNAGSTVANHVAVSNTLPAGFSYSAIVNAHGGQFISGQNAVLQLGSVGIGAVKSVTIIANTTVPGLVTNVAGVGSALTDSPSADNALALVTSVIEAVDLGLILSDSPDPVVVGTTLTYTLVVTNRGPSPATGVVLTNLLPGTAGFISATTSAGTVSHAAGLVTANLGALAAGASATVTINALPSATGTLTDAAGVVSAVTELNAADNDASVKTTVISQPVLTQQVIGASLVFTWPAEAGNFTLVYTDSLTPPVTWQPVGVTPTDAGAVFQVVIPIDGAALNRFYTLLQAP
jgi:uncharacterized repeat protein (TIGR01451 family)/uncharacterized delta-60 repeat protein